MADVEKLPDSLENILKKASEEILIKQEGHCFTIDNTEQPTNESETYSLAYDPNELSEFINADMLVENNNFKSSNDCNSNKKYEDLLGNGMVLKEELDPG